MAPTDPDPEVTTETALRAPEASFGDLPAADPGESREGFPPVAVLIPADPEALVRLMHLPEGLDAMRAAIGGGWLEVLDTGPSDDPGRAILWCDEEGKLKGHRTNARATTAARYLVDADWMGTHDVLAGDVLVTGTDGDGETTGIPAHALLALRADPAMGTWRDDRTDPPRPLAYWTPDGPTVPSGW